MSTSLAAVFSGTAGQVELQQIALPTPGEREILVRVLGCTLCGSDLHTFDGRRTTPTPTILGHEIVGRIEAMGERCPQDDLAGQPLAIGDRVTWSIVANCGNCFYCQNDLPQKCVRAVKYGHERFQPGRELLGGLAEHCLLAAGTSLVRLPASLPLEVACPASCATATIAAALEAAGDLHRRSVGVLGAGMLGLTACAMARAAGAAEVVCVDLNAARRELALEFGAGRAVAPAELAEVAQGMGGGRGLDAVIELTGSPAAFESAWPTVRMGGTIVLVGSVYPAPAVSVSLEQVVRRCLTIRGVHNYAPKHLLTAVQFLADWHGRYPFAGLVGEWYPLEEVREALHRAGEAGLIRVGVKPAVS